MATLQISAGGLLSRNCPSSLSSCIPGTVSPDAPGHHHVKQVTCVLYSYYPLAVLQELKMSLKLCVTGLTSLGQPSLQKGYSGAVFIPWPDDKEAYANHQFAHWRVLNTLCPKQPHSASSSHFSFGYPWEAASKLHLSSPAAQGFSFLRMTFSGFVNLTPASFPSRISWL